MFHTRWALKPWHILAKLICHLCFPLQNLQESKHMHFFLQNPHPITLSRIQMNQQSDYIAKKPT